jgi:hypothetical protein
MRRVNSLSDKYNQSTKERPESILISGDTAEELERTQSAFTPASS